MSESFAITFVIPAYNASQTIVRTLNSIYALPVQETEFEIIVIDDCSTDSTINIVSQYAQTHTNLRLLRQPENHRQGAARNWGIREAKGEYIMLVDADDVVLEGVINALKWAQQLHVDMVYCSCFHEVVESGVPHALQIARQTHVDCLFCNYVWMYSDLEEEHRTLPLTDGFVCSGREFCENYYDTIVNTCPIAYLWKTEYLQKEGSCFVEDRRMEDFDWIEKNIYKAPKVGNTTAIVYRVLTYENIYSTTHTMNYETYADWVHVAYRRWIFCDSILTQAPTFCSKIEEQCRAFVSSSFTLRRVSRLSPINLYKAFKRITPECGAFLYKKEGWTLFAQCVIFLDAVVWIPTTTARHIVHTIRKR